MCLDGFGQPASHSPLDRRNIDSQRQTVRGCEFTAALDETFRKIESGGDRHVQRLDQIDCHCDGHDRARGKSAADTLSLTTHPVDASERKDSVEPAGRYAKSGRDDRRAVRSQIITYLAETFLADRHATSRDNRAGLGRPRDHGNPRSGGVL